MGFAKKSRMEMGDYDGSNKSGSNRNQLNHTQLSNQEKEEAAMRHMSEEEYLQFKEFKMQKENER